MGFPQGSGGHWSRDTPTFLSPEFMVAVPATRTGAATEAVAWTGCPGLELGTSEKVTHSGASLWSPGPHGVNRVPSVCELQPQSLTALG